MLPDVRQSIVLLFVHVSWTAGEWWWQHNLFSNVVQVTISCMDHILVLVRSKLLLMVSYKAKSFRLNFGELINNILLEKFATSVQMILRILPHHQMEFVKLEHSNWFSRCSDFLIPVKSILTIRQNQWILQRIVFCVPFINECKFFRTKRRNLMNLAEMKERWYTWPLVEDWSQLYWKTAKSWTGST